MAEQVLAWEGMREKRKEGDRNQAKQRLMETGEKEKKKKISLASKRGVVAFQYLRIYKNTALEWVKVIVFSIWVALLSS